MEQVHWWSDEVDEKEEEAISFKSGMVTELMVVVVMIGNSSVQACCEEQQQPFRNYCSTREVR